jgi:hypothetical protein
MPPNQSRILFDKGLSHFNNKEYEKASKLFQEAVMENPEFHECLYNLACCFSMLGDADNALVYLNRAAQLNMHCLDWAKEDKELNNIRENPIFKKILQSKDSNSTAVEGPKNVESNEDFQEMVFETLESASAKEVKKDMPKFDDGKNKKTEKPKEYMPPCLLCGGLVEKEMRPRYSPKLSISLVLGGMVMTVSMVISFLGLLGIPVIAVGLYLLVSMDEVCVCQNCGAVGNDCGQPEMGQKSKSNQEI